MNQHPQQILVYDDLSLDDYFVKCDILGQLQLPDGPYLYIRASDQCDIKYNSEFEPNIGPFWCLIKADSERIRWEFNDENGGTYRTKDGAIHVSL